MRTAAPSSVKGVAVVVPAHDEQELIGACVAGIRRAAAHPALSGVGVHLVVVLDDCRDSTARRAATALAAAPGTLAATIMVAPFRNVGRARALGAAEGAVVFGAFDPETVWLATTDADSVVPANWLAHHLELRQRGFDGCAGTVVVDCWREHPPSTRSAFEAHYRAGGQSGLGHPHVHGSNLGVSLAAYRQAGGFPPLPSGEDHALWRALAGSGRRLAATPMAPVTTSGRRHGRSPAGFAGTLVRLGSLPPAEAITA